MFQSECVPLANDSSAYKVSQPLGPATYFPTGPEHAWHGSLRILIFLTDAIEASTEPLCSVWQRNGDRLWPRFFGGKMIVRAEVGGTWSVEQQGPQNVLEVGIKTEDRKPKPIRLRITVILFPPSRCRQ
jgi:hypothetical protein